MQDLAIQNPCDHRVLAEEAQIRGSQYLLLDQEPDPLKDLTVSRAGQDLTRFAFSRGGGKVFLDLNNVSLGGPVVYLSSGDTVLVSYYVKDVTTCPRCGGTGYADDLMETEDGVFKVVLEDGLAQAIEKLLSTRRGTNPYHSWYGSTLMDLVGEKVADTQYIKSRIEMAAREAIQTYMDAYQNIWATAPGAELGDRIDTIDRVEASQDEEEPSLFYLEVDYTTGSGNTISFEQSLRLNYYKLAR